MEYQEKGVDGDYAEDEYYLNFKPFCVLKKVYLSDDKKTYTIKVSRNYKQILKAFIYRLLRKKHWYYFLIRSLEYN